MLSEVFISPAYIRFPIVLNILYSFSLLFFTPSPQPCTIGQYHQYYAVIITNNLRLSTYHTQTWYTAHFTYTHTQFIHTIIIHIDTTHTQWMITLTNTQITHAHNRNNNTHQPYISILNDACLVSYNIWMYTTHQIIYTTHIETTKREA